ncbi:ribokinase [Arthrobacter bambusae]|uniref:ribokinase n=1 Tax=Arthrobacter bambusae TaxID=1338426 RepID=UPI001F51560F|nr:ribokinase [Arthrobacter bambusae]MCI0143782.1 ribokinase [Arthrobacter bambusae]
MSIGPQQKVVVVGSVNQDIVLSVPAIPQPGETLLATSSRVAPGGKGANQAVAASRAGVRTEFVGSFGSDAASEELRSALESEGVAVASFAQSSKPSGRAIVLVDEAGDNCIVVDLGANGDLTANYVSNRLQDLAAGDVLVVQCELSQKTIEAALETGQSRGAVVILNLAPFRQLHEHALRSSTLIVVNEGEAANLVEKEPPLQDPADVAQSIARKYDCICIITLGERGSIVARKDGTDIVTAMAVKSVVDTTGAGDAFVGTLAAKLAAGADLLPAVHAATAAAAYTVMGLGAQASPVAQEAGELIAGPAA